MRFMIKKEAFSEGYKAAAIDCIDAVEQHDILLSPNARFVLVDYMTTNVLNKA